MEKEIFSCAIPKCYFCGRDKNEIVMTSLLTEENAKRVKEMHGRVIDKEPCDECKKIMEQGVMLIKVREGDPDYRLGQLCALKDEAIEKIFPEEQAKQLLKMRAGFIGEELWDMIGLPNGEAKEC